MSFEGIYKWVAFLPSKVDPNMPVLNRYFGAYQDGELKVRGIEARRHDTPPAFAECQMEILRVLAKARLGEGGKGPGSPNASRSSSGTRKRWNATRSAASELAFTTNLSKGPEEYTSMTVQHAAVKRLVGEGVELHAGEGIRYVITDYGGRDSKRATPVDVMGDEVIYDSKRYIELLAETCSSILEPFDTRYSAVGLLSMYEAHRNMPLT